MGNENRPSTGIISSFDAFTSSFQFNEESEKGSKRKDALKKYFGKGGVIKAVNTGREWPKLLYPNRVNLKRKIDDLSKTISLLESKKRHWQKKLFEAKMYNIKNNAFKFFDPLYWKHNAKKLVDSDYRHDANSVNLPVEMVSEPKYRPMIDTFLKDIDYRKQLTMTVENSIVYKNDKRVARYAEELRGFRMDTATKNLKSLEQKINLLQEEKEIFREIMQWHDGK